MATRKYNGVHFGNRTSKRDLSLGQVGVENPGPGAYNVQEGRAGDSVNLNSVTAAKNSTSIEALSLELPVPRRHTSPAKRFTEEVQLKAEREVLHYSTVHCTLHNMCARSFHNVFSYVFVPYKIFYFAIFIPTLYMFL